MHISGLILKDLSQFPDAFAGVAFSPYQLAALNNAAPVTYIVSKGALPRGMSLSAIGLFSGTPTVPGNYSWTVQFTDGVDTEYRGFNINVYAIDIKTAGQLPNATQNAAYNITVSASGGAGGYQFSGSVPTGLTLSSAGVISGTVTSGPVRWPFSLTVVDSAGASYSKLMMIQVLGA
jgi:large repetitive protein